MDINSRYTYENQHNIAYLLNRQIKLRYSEPIVNYIWNSGRYWILGQSWKDDSARQISNTNYATAARNIHGGNWQTYIARNKACKELKLATTTWTKSDREMRGVTSHKILNADWSK